MDCRMFNTLADDIARGCLADEEIRKAATNHAETCLSCARRLAEAERLTLALRQFAASVGVLQAPPEVEKTLRIRFAQQRNLAQWHRRRQRLVLGAVAAAALLAALSVFLLLKSGGMRQNQPKVSITRPIVKAPEKMESTPADRSLVASARREAKNRQSVASENLRNVAGMEKGFIPLPYGEGSPAPAEEQVIRVRLPDSVLEEIGLPAPNGPAARYVTADVLLGEDGIARAIRIVQ
jgi:hypothetical protein